MRYLELNEAAKAEVIKADEYDFNIFNLRKHTNGNELFSILPFLIARRGIMGSTDLNFNKLMEYLKHL